MKIAARCLGCFALLTCFATIASADHCPRGTAGLVFERRFKNHALAARTARRLLTADHNGDRIADCLEKSLRIPLSPDNVASRKAALELFLAGQLDSDGDGLTDAEESMIGTNPYLVDSNFDGEFDSRNFLRQASAKCKIVKKKVRTKTKTGKIVIKIKRVKVCKRSITPQPTPTPTATAIPEKPAPTPTPRPTPTRTPVPTASAGDASAGKAFYTRNCTSCHGKRTGYSESQVNTALQTIPVHVAVRTLVSAQALKDIAAYLQSNL